MSNHNYTRTQFGSQWDVDPVTLGGEVEAALTGKAFNLKVGRAAGGADQMLFSFVDVLTAGEVTTLDTVVSDHKAAFDVLKKLKQQRYAEIDERTKQLIGLGFEFPPTSGSYFSLTLESQIRLEAADASRDLPEFAYPVAWNTLDDDASYSIPDSATMHSFFLTALGTIRARIDSGTSLKDSVRAATTQAELDAVVDGR
jgi:hypothetical protein